MEIYYMIELKHVSRNFNNTVAVDDLNFKLSSGETLGIIGQNGAGKSTTFRMIMGFIEPSEGQILVDGKLVNEKKGILLDLCRRNEVCIKMKQ